MKLYYDFHIHTALSPCGDTEMTPNNIVNMAQICELNAIAITDHNIAGNVAATMKAAEGTGLLVVPGMEVETSEEAHVVCLFPSLENLLCFEQVIRERLPNLKNKPEIFGTQLFYNKNDEVVGEHDGMLVVATSIDLYSLSNLVKEHSGVFIPAHVDRPSYSIISNLGFIPLDLPMGVVEISKHVDPVEYMHNNKKLFGRKFKFVQSSDAHYLENIGEAGNFLEVENEPTVQGIIEMLRGLV